MNFKFYFILAIILASFSTVKAQYDENDNYLKGKFQKALISEKNYSVKQVIYSADAKTLATDWRSSGFTLVTKKGTNYFSTGKYVANANITAFGPAITLPKVINGECIILQLDQQFKTETEYDYICVWASTDGGETGSWVYRKSGKSGGAIIDYADLTHLAGKTVQLSLQFSADGSEQSDGWDISGISLFTAEKSRPNTGFLKSMLKSGGADTVIKVISVNTENYADDVFLKFTVEDANGNFIPGLTMNDFNFYDEHQLRNGCHWFEQDNWTGRFLDILFLVDNSGSMSDEQLKVEQNINSLLDTMAGQYDVRIGLFRFGQSSGTVPVCPAYAVEELAKQNKLFYPLYTSSDVSLYMDSVWSRNIATGGYEPYHEVLNWAADQPLNYRPEAQKIFILIGDEEVDDGFNNKDCNGNASTLTQSDVAAKLVSEDIQAFVFAKYAYGYESDYTTIVSETGGMSVDVDANSYAAVLDSISAKLVGTYTYHYCMPEVSDDSTRLAEVELKSGNASDSLLYTVKDFPSLIRTNPTVALSETAQLPDQSLTIATTLYTNYPDSVLSFEACYKHYHSANYTCGAATEISRGVDSLVYSFTIPADSVDAPLVQYYFNVIMANSTRIEFSPLEEQAYDSWTIPVQPNYPPLIDSVYYNPPLNSLSPCAPVTIYVHATDTTTNLDEVTLYYKVNRSLGSYIDVTMTSLGSDWYSATIPDYAAKERGVSYYILAQDNYGTQGWHGSPEAPLQMKFENITFSNYNKFNVYFYNYAAVTNQCEALLETDTAWAYFVNDCGDLQKGGMGVYTSPMSYILLEVYGDPDPNDGKKTGFSVGDTIIITVDRNGFEFPVTIDPLFTPLIYPGAGTTLVNAATANQVPRIEIEGNGETISPGQTVTSASDNTSFGTCDSLTSHTFTFTNTGCEDLYISEIMVSDTANFTITAAIPQTITSGNSANFTVSYKANETADAVVSVYNNTNTSPYKFTVAGSAAGSVPNCTDISISPNPLASWGGNASIPIYIQTTLTVKVYDLMGNLMSTSMNNQTMSAGTHSIFIDGGGLSSSTYYILNVTRGAETCGLQFITQ